MQDIGGKSGNNWTTSQQRTVVNWGGQTNITHNLYSALTFCMKNKIWVTGGGCRTCRCSTILQRERFIFYSFLNNYIFWCLYSKVQHKSDHIPFRWLAGLDEEKGKPELTMKRELFWNKAYIIHRLVSNGIYCLSVDLIFIMYCITDTYNRISWKIWRN